MRRLIRGYHTSEAIQCHPQERHADLEWESMEVKIDDWKLHRIRLKDDIVLTTPSVSQVERILDDFGRVY